MSHIEKFRAEEPAVVAWLEERMERNTFAASLHKYAAAKGYLTPGQLAAVLNSIEKDRLRAETAKDAPAVDTTRLEAVFDIARKSPLKKPALTIGAYRFNPAPEDGANPGAIYVKKDGVYMGKMLRGALLSRLTGDWMQDVLEIAGDPEGAAIRHGKLTGRCAVCSRKLSDPESTSRGIGPICAEKFGW